MDIYILRHGIAVERGEGHYAEADRPLTGKGEKQMRRIARAIEKLKLSFDVILSSPYTRAKETAQIVAEYLGCVKALDFSEALEPGGPSDAVIDLLRKGPGKSVMLVGHEPDLSQLIAVLTGARGLSIDLAKGGLCKVVAEGLGKNDRATLEWLLTPKQMKLIAKKN